VGLIIGTLDGDGYRPPLMHRLLKPRITGNAINGLGERAFRRPRPIYHWRGVPGVKLAFRWVQELFYLRDLIYPYFRVRLKECFTNLARPRAPVAETRVSDTPENWSRRVKEFALANEADLVGIARMDPAWVYEGFTIEQPWIIVLGVAEDYDKIATAPAHTSNMEVLDQYNRGHRAGMKLADWIRGQGWYSDCHKGFVGAPVSMIPAAIAAGLGELGKHGSLINRRYGPRFRLGYVLTDLPLVADRPDALAVDDFCASCRLCTRECPPQAIFETKQWVRGALKWYVDFDRCVPYFNDTFGCNICIKVCPYSRPGVSESLVQKMLRRREAA
jgi:Pyruvate/2-oxoacid:ferredoxin oxidoreductase delta subunit